MVRLARQGGKMTLRYAVSLAVLAAVLAAGVVVLEGPTSVLPTDTATGISRDAGGHEPQPLLPEGGRAATGSAPSSGRGAAASTSDGAGPVLLGRTARGGRAGPVSAVVDASLPYDPSEWKDPRPPPEYRGSALAWHLRSDPPSAEIEGYLASGQRLPAGEFQGLLHYLHMRPRPEMLEPLLSVRPAVPRTTFMAGHYSRALSSTAVAASQSGVGATRQVQETVKEACLVALAMHRDLIVATGRDTQRGSWASLRRQLQEKWAKAVPGFALLPEAQADIEAIRTVLEAQFETAWAPNGSYAGEDVAIALALDIGDADTVDALLRLLDHWDVARTRLGAAFPSRKDISALSLAGQIVEERGSTAQLTAWAWWVIDRKVREAPDARELRVLDACARRLASTERLAQDVRARLRAAFGIRSSDEGGGR
jgi:hypothetical protein